MTDGPPLGLNFTQGTLDLLILRTLLFGPAHGHAITKHIQRTSDDLLGKRAKYYPLTRRGRRQLVAERHRWETSG